MVAFKFHHLIFKKFKHIILGGKERHQRHQLLKIWFFKLHYRQKCVLIKIDSGNSAFCLLHLKKHCC